MPDYKLGKIYRIVSTVDNKIYVGSTAQKYLCTRMAMHRTSAKNGFLAPIHQAMKEQGVEKFTIILEKAFPCNSRAELEAEEYKTIQTYLQNGTELYNVFMRKVRAPSPKPRKKCQYGTMNCYEDGKGRFAWKFFWKENGKLMAKSWACRKYGYWEAKNLAEAEKKKVFPEWEKEDDEDKEVIAEFGAIDLA